eukprot:g276.t1
MVSEQPAPGASTPVEQDELRQFSLFSFGMQLSELHRETSVWERTFQVVFLATSVAIPLLLTGVLLTVWVLPLQPKTQNRLLELGHALDAWVALDVFVIVVAICSLDFGRMTSFAAHQGPMREACELMKRELSETICVRADVKLEKGFVMLAAAAAATLLVPKVVLRACRQAIMDRDQANGRSWASSAATRCQTVGFATNRQVNDAKPGLPLEGITMVFTGEMDQMSRADAEEKAKAAGAKVLSAVSGNVQFLVVGTRLDDGRSVEETGKYRKMLELKEKGKKHPTVMTEGEFLERLPDAAAAAVPRLPIPSTVTAPAGPSYQSWVDRWAPKSFGDLIGNAGVIKKLTEWLRDWDDVVFKGKVKKAAFKPGGGMPENINARAVLISGPPGIGKTTACRLVAQLHGGYEATGSGGANKAAKVRAVTRKAVIIMDEVDGMGAGDRGGMAALNRTQMVKKTRNPVICICNDSHSQKVRSFQRPTRTTVAQRCAQIAASEGLQVEPNALEALAESCGSDMRMVPPFRIS